MGKTSPSGISVVEKRERSKAGLRAGFLFYVGWFGLIAIVANLSGGNQATVTIAYATISGVILALYSVLEQEKQLRVVFLVLVSILLSLSSSIVSLDRAALITGDFWVLPSFSKGQFFVSSVIFAGSTYYFVSSISMEKFVKKNPSREEKD